MMQPSSIRSAAVLGAGTMGSQIAAHLANAGIPVLLLDVTPEAAREGLKKAAALKPDPFFTKQAIARISTGGFFTDLARVSSADWIIEAVVEKLDVKQMLFTQIEPLRAPHAIVSSNTSGIPIAALADGRSADFRAHLVGTHFFNPVHIMKLLELVVHEDTSDDVLARVRAWGMTSGSPVSWELRRWAWLCCVVRSTRRAWPMPAHCVRRSSGHKRASRRAWHCAAWPVR